MIQRLFDDYKFTRTYIGGSKAKENKLLKEVDKNEDWIRYKSLATEFFDDSLNVILSWKIITKTISQIIGVISIISLFAFILTNGLNSKYTAIFGIVTALIFFIVSKVLEKKLRKWHFSYDLILGFILNKIEETTKIKLSKNN
jgi:hypothetical protein